MANSPEKILVTGARGMLAGDLVPVLQSQGLALTLTDVDSLDITDAGQVGNMLAAEKPDWIVNCAAYTQVDDAETKRDAAFAVNHIGVENLARAAADNDCRLLHVSTDYVFGGSDGKSPRREAYKEDDTAEPCGGYGESKLAGEQAVREVLPDGHCIVRTSWLHGHNGPNFLETMLRLGRERDELRIVDDQIGSPTWTGWLSEVILKLIYKDSRGTFHACSKGEISWFDFAKEIFSQAEIEINLATQTTEELNRPAPRPRYSKLDTAKLEAELGEDCISWQGCVSNHLGRLQ